MPVEQAGQRSRLTAPPECSIENVQTEDGNEKSGNENNFQKLPQPFQIVDICVAQECEACVREDVHGLLDRLKRSNGDNIRHDQQNHHRYRQDTPEIQPGETVPDSFRIENTENYQSTERKRPERPDRMPFKVDTSALVQKQVSENHREIKHEPQASIVGKLVEETFGTCSPIRGETGFALSLFLSSFGDTLSH